ncbi:MAG: hemolysin family protein [Phycisphaerales bacterium]|nr:hemolysin family protein [Phycisphaerales bacterium]
MTLDVFLENINRIIALGVLMVVSGMISASETALFALSRQQLNRFRQSKKNAGRTVLRLRKEPSELLSTVLLANIAVNILLYAMLGVTVTRLAREAPFWTTVFGIVGFLIVLFGAEIIPKLIAYTFCERIAPVVALPLRVLEIVTLPFRRLLGVTLVEPLTRLFSSNPGEASVSADELQRLVNVSQSEGLIDDRENVLLHQLMELSDLRVSALMTPRVDVVAFNLAEPPGELAKLIKANRLLRIPVFEDKIDNIKGLVFAKEYLLNPDSPIRRLIRPVHFIPEQARVEALLRHFRHTRSQLALVVDEYGGLAGVVALEDVVEAIVGELRAPEERKDLPTLLRIDDSTYLVDAGLDIDEFCRAFELPLEETRINTVGGRVVEMLDRLPVPGDEITIGHTKLRVAKMKNRRILRVRVTLDRPVADNPDLALLLEENSSEGKTGK